MPLPTVTGSLAMCGPGPGGQMGALRLHPSRVAEGPGGPRARLGGLSQRKPKEYGRNTRSPFASVVRVTINHSPAPPLRRRPRAEPPAFL